MQGYIFSLVVRVMNNIPIIRLRRKKVQYSYLMKLYAMEEALNEDPKDQRKALHFCCLVLGGGSLAVLKV